MRFFLIIVITFFVFSSSLANRFIIHEENDVFTGSDDDYTQGLSLTYADNDSLQFTIFQTIYTPYDISNPSSQPDDRPWSGILAFSLGEQSSSSEKSILIGAIGEWSLADDTQKMFHEIIGSEKPLGWSNQVPNEIVINASYYKVYPIVYDFGNKIRYIIDTKVGGEFGTAFINTSVDNRLKIGIGNINSPPIYIFPKSVNTDEYGCFLFADLIGIFQLHNVTINGSMFDDSVDYNEIEQLVGEYRCGVGINFESFEFHLGIADRSREYVGQKHSTDYGFVEISINF